MTIEQPDDEEVELRLGRQAAKMAPWLVAGNCAVALVFGYVVLGEYVVKLGIPESFAFFTLGSLALIRLFLADRRYANYLAGGVITRKVGTLAMACVLALSTVALSVLVGAAFAEPVVAILLFALCLWFGLYQRRLTRRLYPGLATPPQWLWIAKVAAIGGAATLTLTSMLS